MKTKLLLFLLTFFFCSTSLMAVVWPTNVVVVNPDNGINIGALDNAIATNRSAIYILKRGGYYYTNGALTLPAEPIIIRAEPGNGPRPVIMGGVPSTAWTSSVIIVTSDFKMDYIYVSGEDQMGNIHKNTIRVNAGTSFEFNSCMFDKDLAGSFRNEAINCRYNFYDCIFRNEVDYAGVANGRCFDARDAKVGLKLIMKNCTFYNVSKEIIRPSTSVFDSIVFVNNTCYSIMEGLNFGKTKFGICNNNIFYNCGLMGAATSTAGLFSIDSMGTKLDHSLDDPRRFEFKNNLFYTDQAYKDVQIIPSGQTRYIRKILNPSAIKFALNAQLICTDTIKNQSIAFTNPPPKAVGYVQYMWANIWPSSFTPTTDQRIEVMEDPLNIGDPVSPKVPFNFAYPTTSPAFTGGLNGDILGDKHWFGLSTGLENLELTNTDKVKAYFINGTLNLIFSDPEPGVLNLHLYSLDGRELANRQIYGQTKSQVDIPGLSKGIYIYIVESTSNNGTKRLARGKVAF